MPNYNAAQATAIYPGDSLAVVNAESPANNQASQQAAIATTVGGGLTGFSIDYSFAAVPGAVQYDVQVAEIDTDSSYVKIDSLANVNGGHVDYGGIFCRFVRVKCINNGAVTATVRINR